MQKSFEASRETRFGGFHAHSEHGLTCAALGLSRTVYRYELKPRDDSPIIEALLRLADRYPRYGFGKLFAVLSRHGFRWNHKRVYRVYCLLKMNLRRKGKKRLSSRNPQPLAVPPCANVCWSIDFMHDALASGQRFSTFNVLGDFRRECLAIEVDTNLPAARVLRFWTEEWLGAGCLPS